MTLTEARRIAQSICEGRVTVSRRGQCFTVKAWAMADAERLSVVWPACVWIRVGKATRLDERPQHIWQAEINAHQF